MNLASLAHSMPAAARQGVFYIMAIRRGPMPQMISCGVPLIEEEQPEWDEIEQSTLPAPRFRGEILRDASGRLYQRHGQMIRPLETLAVSPSGEIIEMPPPSPEVHAPLLRAVAEGRVFKRLLPWRGWKEQLAGQVAQPEQLTESVKLPCDITVFELVRPATLKQVQQEERVLPLDELTMRRLGLAGQLPAGEAAATEGDSYKQGSRFYRIVLANDPTAFLQHASRSSAPTVASPPSLKCQVPAKYQRPWEFQYSREEAITRIERDAASSGKWRNRLIRALLKADEDQLLRHWQAHLVGKSFDDQLWAVRPPQDCWRLDGIKPWVEKTLAQAGYQIHEMLREWEIYWRRKGV